MVKLIKTLKNIGALVFIVVGVVFTFVVTGAIEKQHNRCTLETPATIVDYETNVSKDEDGHVNKTYAPVYSYTGSDGNSYELADSTYTGNMPEIGSKTKIMVNPDDPTDFYNPELDGSLTTIFRIIGIVFMVIGVIVLLIPVGKRF